MMIVRMILVHGEQYVLIQKTDLLVYVHHGKMIVLMLLTLDVRVRMAVDV